MAKRELDQVRTVYRCSSSIANFKDRLSAVLQLPEWHWWKDRKATCIFFGLYHEGDYKRFFWHKGPKRVFWCGSDILNLMRQKPTILRALAIAPAKHYCENPIEYKMLVSFGIIPEVRPLFFDNPNYYDISYRHSETPHVFLNCHPGREIEYGINLLGDLAHILPEFTFHVYGVEGDSFSENIVWHGLVPPSQFNWEIRAYQAGLRLNLFDGFGEVLAKSILMGQYPISRIWYPEISYAYQLKDLVRLLQELKTKTEPNVTGREFWLRTLKENLQVIIRA